ncbi:hypothetical protein P153DRAFT_345676 [Dothidotthia symphoricarpi CBS 119687]|uniref:Pheromone alpha factor receptor n=1 Tax=Dothidotthia symphoricarpi CBS 119687 TaxID=1392245 RepID=A0A6A6A558_9PLEO|nr:uncharacterized protein P153DRAFT_345676 [Dothidotthia symphoricarpi CBS 119687]KAF2126940.1 hypothetical protein P153DRAFT_345676 [Dothidotthia symphoricarpi CBS 119687]
MPPSFDAWEQQITLLHQDGSNFTVTMTDFEFYRLYGIRRAINVGSQIGASIILLLVLLLLTRSEKRKSWIFVMNALCLVTNAVRCILSCTFLTGNFWHPYAQASGDWSRITSSDLATTVATNTMTLIVTILVMVSLSLQVWVVCITTIPVYRYFIMGITTLVALIAVGFKFAVIIISNEQTLKWNDMLPYQDLISTSYIMQAVAIWLFSCVFTWKLGHAIIQRRKLKMPQFGPMQIVFIMGCQTMIIPGIFSTLEFHRQVPELGQQVLTIVCIFLPLSAIWAGVVNESNVAYRGPDSNQRLLHNQFYGPASTSSMTSGATACEKNRQLSIGTYRKSGVETDSVAASLSPRQKSLLGDDRIHVNRKFSVHSDSAEDQA